MTLLVPPLPVPAGAVVAVLRAPTAAHFAAASTVLWDAGIRFFEYTLTSDGALEAMTTFKAAVPEAVIGIGTVRAPHQLQSALNAGAQFGVSQIFLTELVEAARSLNLPFVPGALTPTEVVTAWAAGVPAVKVSPIGPLGGVRYLQELRGPLPDVPLMPTGGVTLEAVSEYLAAGAVAVGVSGALFEDALLGGDLTALRQRADHLMSICPALEGNPL
ncbi:MAG TPA: bifunctional 4-hydroxy-2-oxoglutarate aldolase/2-dehydro-3-deoxy-phosphogluconate aldolase [Microlunatus sp.]